MATTFAQQLRSIAAQSTNELDLRARRNAHAESLIFERSVAVKQDWDTLYQLCLEAFQELCTLDARFRDFERSLFSRQSKDQDREQLNKAQNEDLDNVIEVCLQTLGSRLTLRPGVRALEWLIRRFRIHVYNIRSLLLTALPHHEHPLFQNVLSLISPDRLVDEWKFLRPYHKNAVTLPRHAVVYAATNNEGFFSALNNYTLSSCRRGTSHPLLMRFWSGLIVEAVAGRLNQAKSGRQEVQRQRTEDVLHKVLPVLDEGLTTHFSPDLTLTCFALALVLANTGMLDDGVIDSLVDGISKLCAQSAIGSAQALPAIAVLVSQKSDPFVPRKVLTLLSGLSDLEALFSDISQQYPTQALFLGVIRTTLRTMKKKNVDEKAAFLRTLLHAGPAFESTAGMVQWLLAIVAEIQRLDPREAPQSTVRYRLISLLQEAQESERMSPAFVQLASVSRDNGLEIEDLLQTAIAPPNPAPALNNVMDIDQDLHVKSGLDLASAALPPTLPNEVNFLSVDAPPIYSQLLDVLRLCNKNEDSLLHFSKLELWHRPSSETETSQYTGFLIRVALSESSANARTDSTTLLARDIATQAGLNAQALLPYASVLLADPSPAVRRLAAAIVIAIHNAATTETQGAPSSTALELYTPQQSTKLASLTSKQLLEVLQQVYLPNIEEFATDEEQIALVLQHALGGTVDQALKSSKGGVMELKKGLRQAFFDCLTSHANHAPFLRVKTGMIKILTGVSKAGSIRKSEALLPILSEWARLGSAEARAWATREGLQLATIDKSMASLISSKERDSISRVLDFLETRKGQTRDEFLTSIFDRIVEIWTTLAEDVQQPLALKIYDLALTNKTPLAGPARAALQQVRLSTEALQALLSSAIADSQEMQDQPHPKRRRRSSSHGVSRPTVIATSFRESLSRLSLALELIDSSKPENRPALLPSLVETLLYLRRARDRIHTESPYLLTLCLGAMLAIVDKLKTARRPNIDWANIRADLVAECVRKTESPQVQTTALMLSASLASIAPDKVIHHIMPVFTFMGGKMLAQEDQLSINVVYQAIDDIIPPLVASLRRQDAQNIFQSTKSLLSSFVVAFNHIPDQRKVSLYQRLLTQLGPEDFGFAIVAMLADQTAGDRAFQKFLSLLFAAFEPRVYLEAYSKLLSLAEDMYAHQPRIAESILGVTSGTPAVDKEARAMNLLSTAKELISSKSMRSRVSKLSKTDTPDASALAEQFRGCLRQTLQSVQDVRKHANNLQMPSGQCLVALLELVSIKQLIESLSALLDEIPQTDANLKPKAMRLLASRLESKSGTDSATAEAALGYLSKLESVVTTTDDQTLKFTAIECIDRICTKYGRRDIDAVVSPAASLAGEAGLGSDDNIICTTAAHTLASMLEILRDAAVPIVPSAFDYAFKLIERSAAENGEDESVLNAAFILVGSIVHNIPFMVSEDNLDRILTVSALAATSSFAGATVTTMNDMLDEVARQIDIDTLTSGMLRTWVEVVQHGLEAVLPILTMYGTAVQHHAKGDVVRSADNVSNIILQAFDLRRTQLLTESSSYSSSDICQVEASLNNLTLAFIYKLSDVTFRPLFTSWVDWATKVSDLSLSPGTLPVAKLHRQTTLTSFLTHFFTTLKSIVTSYASYLIGPANEALAEISKSQPSDSSSVALYANLLAALRAAFTHDADSFFATPSHFEPLAKNLVSQLHLASHKSLRPLIFEQVIPTLVSFASAVQESPSHHLALNHYLARLRHADSSHVRLASIRTHMAMTEDGEVGDEWVNNVVSGTVSGEGLVEGEKAGVGGSGETMIYVSEMLEDDDEEVEKEVRRWVRIVRERLGEEIFET
ncbi:uncharacterized protein HMPREF1541_00480 [Cyphellophora europaea CBS 101466]|uniref:U3 small nucleolar RNA-associated protein 10 n=1 Tax=Cyphellophora europaea (strain CBS 101466) TaxID=1220924 RepID=W2SC42_CYPE1|nr:uncharacterized protein HMPREF1541_00480 [Cyphellophora europaea CBS 101466]ETN46296.1 hypothetical protein HMPREF1541_00480 [Cyphellophora europaea CBS 101466]